LLDLYVDWAEVVAERVCRMGFDVFVSTDDIAFGAATFFSPEVFRELVYPVSSVWRARSRSHGSFTPTETPRLCWTTSSASGSPRSIRSSRVQ